MATQINVMGFSYLNVGLHNDFHYQAYGKMKATGAQALHIENLLPAYGELVELESSIVRRQTTYVSTVQLNDADKVRDNAMGVILNIITAHKTNTIEAKRSAALALDAMVAPYRGISNHEKRTQTREVAGLLAVLNKEEAMAHIATLNLTEEVALLAEKNAAFEAVFNKKLQEEVERLPQKDIDTEELRKQVDEKYTEIVQTVNAYAIVQPTEAIEAFIAQMNGLISLTKPGSSSGSSSGGSTGGSTDTESEPTPDPEPTPTPDPEPTPTPDPDTGEDDDDEGGLAG
jgi:hypothetical protein